MSGRLPVVVAVMASLASGTLGAGVAKGTVPFSLRHGYLIFVEGSIGGLEGLNLIVDTGASFTTITGKLAGKLQCRGKASRALNYGKVMRTQEVVLPEVRLGEAVFEKVGAHVADLSFFHGVRVDGLIGLNLLKRTSILIDYKKLTLTFGTFRHFPSRTAFYTKSPFVLMCFQAGQEPLALILDTGAPYVVLYQRRVRGRLELVRSKARGVLQNTRGKVEVRKVLIPNIRLEATEWKWMPAHVLEVPTDSYGTLDGVVGPLSLGLSRILLDFQDGLVSWDM